MSDDPSPDSARQITSPGPGGGDGLQDLHFVWQLPRSRVMLITRGYNGAVRITEVPMSDRSKLTLADGVRLHVETSGPADAPVTVVLLHGWCLDRRTWHHQIQ